MPTSAFDIKKCEWKIAWPQRVAKHDLVYQTPPSDPMQGIALGNGDIGALAWCEDSKLIFAINKCDLWDDAPGTSFTNWKPDEEDLSTTLRHACRIVIDFKLPVFNTFYLRDFTARLNLADATMQLDVESAFGSISVTAFVDHDSGLLIGHVKTDLKDVDDLSIIIERYGSRTFSHWYRRINRDPKIGLTGTHAKSDANGVYISHALTSGTFVAGMKLLGKLPSNMTYSVDSLYAGGISLTGKSRKDFEFAVGVTSPSPIKTLLEINSLLKIAEVKGVKDLLAKHRKQWKQFWMRSLMESGNDYLDNLWHLTMYYAYSSQRGRYPGRFINGLWGWNRDVQPWNFYFHWNQQQIYWPLNAAGHHELLSSYLNYRFDSLPYAKETANEFYKSDGAFVSDVCDRRGINSGSEPEPNEPKELDNHTPVAQIALQFWTQYKFTGDKAFLKSQALPYLLEAAKFFESLLRKEKDGKYHAKRGTAYEGWIQMTDTISDLSHARALFRAVLDALKEAGLSCQESKWQEIADNLADLPTIKAAGSIDRLENRYLVQRGLFKGEETLSDVILAAGRDCKTKQMLTSFLPADHQHVEAETVGEIIHKLSRFEPVKTAKQSDFRVYDGIFPWAEYSCVFPADTIGIHNATNAEFEAAVNTVRLYAEFLMGWDVCPIAMARLGLGRELDIMLKQFPKHWQTYCNGWGHYDQLAKTKIEMMMPLARKKVEDAGLSASARGEEENKFFWQLHPFRHMGMESMSVLSCAMNEALLQSQGDIINVAPAVTQNQNARFTLHAQNGFVVSSEVANGKVLWISVKSLEGKVCRIVNPWKKLIVYSGNKKITTSKNRVVEIPTTKSRDLVLVPTEQTLARWKTTPLKYCRNMSCKVDGSNTIELGMPRMF